MPEARNVYLSPHLDDAAFSLGSLIAAEPGGTLVNVFTRSSYVAGRSLHERAGTTEVERVSALRAAEDKVFAERFGLARLDLEAEEPMLWGRDPFAKEGIAESVAQIQPALVATLDAAVSNGATRIFCPAGIGRHADHLAVRAVVITWLGRQRAGSQVWFYEDLPYASRLRARWRGLLDLRWALRPYRLRRRSWQATAEKGRSLNLYSSQHDAPVENLRQFSPAALWPRGSHEAAWELMRQDRGPHLPPDAADRG